MNTPPKIPMFLNQLRNLRDGTRVIIIARIAGWRDFPSKCVITVTDYTGSCLVELVPMDKGRRRKGMRVKIAGELYHNSQGKPMLRSVTEYTILGTVREFEVRRDRQTAEQLHRMKLSLVCDVASEFLKKSGYNKFESDLLSKDWALQGLEPLQVLFPGFGSPVGLVTSPSAQIIEFLIATGLKRAFTFSKSFSTTLRYPSSRTEVLVIMAKATDFDQREFEPMLWSLLKTIVNEVAPEEFATFSISDRIIDVINWSEPLPTIPPNHLCMVRFNDSRPVNRDFWTGSVDSVRQIHLDDRGVLVEGSRELIGTDFQIYSAVIYPAQFLHFLKFEGSRSLENLGRFSVWR